MEILKENVLKLLSNILDDFESEQNRNGLINMRNTAQDLVNTLDNELLNYTEPKFEVGDYVIEQNGSVISKLDKNYDAHFLGLYYKRTLNFFSPYHSAIYPNDIERHATPEEISEYKAALNFHEHGRKPFEFKDLDIVEVNGERRFITYAETSKKKSYIEDGWKLVMTVEEFEELSS